MEPGVSLLHSKESATCHYPEPDQSNPWHHHQISWRLSLILSFHLRLGLPSCFFLSYMPTETPFTSLPSPVLPTFPARLFLLDWLTGIVFLEYTTYRFSWCSFFLFFLSTFPLGPNFFLTPLCSHLSVRDQFSHPSKTAGKVIVLYCKPEGKRLCTEI